MKNFENLSVPMRIVLSLNYLRLVRIMMIFLFANALVCIYADIQYSDKTQFFGILGLVSCLLIFPLLIMEIVAESTYEELKLEEQEKHAPAS